MMALRSFGKIIAGLYLAGAPLCVAHASIPVPVRLIVISTGYHHQPINRAYVEYLSERGNFLVADYAEGLPIIFQPALKACLEEKGDAAAACLRAAIPSHELNKEYPPVIVFATPGEGNSYQWRCVGAGDEDYWPERQSVSLDLEAAMFSDEETREKWGRKALDCIFAAGTEAGGRVRISKD